MYSSSRRFLALAILCLAIPAIAHAQTAPPAATTPAQTAVQTPDADREMVASESDFVIVALPTTLPTPAGKWAFRMTHRFSYAINQGSAGDFFKNFFGFDSTPAVALDVRVGLTSRTQLSVQRVSDRTIQMLGQTNLVRQGSGGVASVDLLTAVEGRENFSEDFGYTVGAAVSHRFADHGAVYVEPMAVFNTNQLPTTGDDNTFLVGLGARLRLGKSKSAVVFEATPRVSGYKPGENMYSFGIEERVGGHIFQLNFSNGFSTTLRQLASQRPLVHNWHIGFNLTRKFF